MSITITSDSATISTAEYFLASDSTTATYQTLACALQALLDLNNLAAGDEFIVRLYEKINGGSARLVESWVLAGAQAKPAWVMPSILVGEGWEVSIQRTAGSDRSIAWSLRKVT